MCWLLQNGTVGSLGRAGEVVGGVPSWGQRVPLSSGSGPPWCPLLQSPLSAFLSFYSFCPRHLFFFARKGPWIRSLGLGCKAAA